MQKDKFQEVFDKLPLKRKQVLLALLKSEDSAKIKTDLGITNDSLTQHKRQLYKNFQIKVVERGDSRTGDRKLPHLIALFAKFMPELVSPYKSHSSLGFSQKSSETLTDSAKLESRLESLIRIFSKSSPKIREQIRDQTKTILEKTDGFIGRQFVFDAIAKFIHTKPCGYFIVRGVPGIGKSSLAAQLVKTEGYLHHFNIRNEGINKPENFLENICAQLIAIYELDYDCLPSEATRDAGFLKKLLNEVSDKLKPNEKAVILIDALDEVDGMPRGVNTLYLPMALPHGVFIIATTRNVTLTLRIECEQEVLDIEQNSDGNIADIRFYIEQALKRQGIKNYINEQGVNHEQFTNHLISKSQGNFMYLRYVLPEIEKGVYKDLNLDSLPLGLKGYYEDHWQRMRGENEDDWFNYKLPVIMALVTTKEPISIDLIVDHSEIKNKARIRSVLKDWQQFLHEDSVEYESTLKKVYRFYHASFHDFIGEKEKDSDEQVSRKGSARKIVDNWKAWFEDE